MKKLLFAAVDMNVGGIETSLLTWLNYLADNNYKITLVLEKKQGIFLKELDNKIDIIEYKPSEHRILFIRKFINLLKRVKFIIGNKNRYDFSVSFATYSNMASFVARTASKNSVLWGHADYLELFKNDKTKVRNFFINLKYNKFKTIIFVAKKACQSFIECFPDAKNKVIYCNNIIDYNKVKNLAREEIDEKKKSYMFVNVGRHDENQKKLTRIIDAAKLLKEDNLDFQILFIGDGKDTKFYKNLVSNYDLEDTIKFLGTKKNPYSYMNLADAVILSSDYEGYPVVFLEAQILNKPIISTDVSDAMTDINNKYGKVVEKDTKQLYLTMKEFIKNGYEIKCKFNVEEYNKEMIRKIKRLINS